MTDRQLLALILGGTCLYAWMLWHLVTRASAGRRGGSMTTWQPIETAPKDGTWMLVWDRNHGTVPARWDGATWMTSMGSQRFVLDEVDYWMDLPTPPFSVKSDREEARERDEAPE